MSIHLRNSSTATEIVTENIGKRVVTPMAVRPVLKTDVTKPSEEKCPVIRANQVILSAASSGRLRVLCF